MRQEDGRSGKVLVYGYDAEGRRLSVADEEGVYARYRYGSNGELTETSDRYGRESLFGYDEAGRLIEEDWADGSVLTRSYTGSGMLESIVERVGSSRATEELVWAEGYLYNDALQVTGTVGLDGEVRVYEYDGIGRLSEVQYPLGSGKMEADRQERERLGLDAEVNRYYDTYDLSFEVEEDLDALYRRMVGLSKGGLDLLSGACKESFSYDSSGNRETVSNGFGTIEYAYDVANRMVEAGNRSYGYDANGNVSWEQTVEEEIAYGYTPENRVRSVSINTLVPGEEQMSEVAYRYDGLGRRISRSSREGSGMTVVSEYGYEGTGFTHAWSAEHGVGGEVPGGKVSIDASGTRYRPVPEQGAVEQVVQSRTRYLSANGRVYGASGSRGDVRYTQDRLGSVRREVGADGQSRSYEYDAYGNSIGPEDPQMFGYTGQQIDPLTKMYDYGYRDYAPSSARFTTVDPIADGSNWYAYVNNDPVNFTDPDGLRPLTPEEKALLEGILGSSYLGTDIDLDRIRVRDREVTVKEVRVAAARVGVQLPMSDEEIAAATGGGRAMSLPNDTIYLPPDPSLSAEARDALTVHEGFHQYQYQAEGGTKVLGSLLQEQQMYEQFKAGGRIDKLLNPYDYQAQTGLGTAYIPSLSAILTYEGQAQFVEDFAEALLFGNPVNPFRNALTDSTSGLSSPVFQDNLKGK